MPSASASENPFKLISDTFHAAYSLDGAAVQVQPFGRSEVISGVQDDGGEISIFRPPIDLGLDVYKVFLWVAAEKEGDIPADFSEEQSAQYLVGGTEAEPIGHEVISEDPYMTRELDAEEMADLARKIGGTTFR